MTAYSSQAATLDAQIDEASPTTVDTTATTLTIKGQTSNRRSLLIKNDFSSIPSTATIHGGRLSLWVSGAQPGANIVIRAYRVLAANSAWYGGAGPNWAFTDGAGASDRWAGDTDNDGGSNAGCTSTTLDAIEMGSVTITSGASDGTRFDIALSASELQLMLAANHGIRVGSIASGNTNTYTVKSTDHATAAQRPLLEIYYTDGAVATPPDLVSSIVRWWEMEAIPTPDESGSGTSLTQGINPPTTAAGKLSNALVFDDGETGDESLTEADNAAISLGGGGPFCISAWAYLDDSVSETSPGAYTILGKMASSGNEEFWFKFKKFFDYRFILSTRTETGATTDRLVQSAASVTRDAWHHVIVWYDPRDLTLKMRLDGGSVILGSVDGAPNDTTHDLYVGAVTGNHDIWVGQIDQVVIAKGVPTTAEQDALYNSGSGMTYTDFIAQFGSAPSSASGLRPIRHGARRWI